MNPTPNINTDIERYSEDEVTKADVVNAIANILIRLGKNDFDGVRKQIWHSSKLFEQWMADRPEKENISNQNINHGQQY